LLFFPFSIFNEFARISNVLNILIAKSSGVNSDSFILYVAGKKYPSKYWRFSKVVKSEIKSTLENQQNLAAQAPENRLYTRSMKMVELGASIEEIIE